MKAQPTNPPRRGPSYEKECKGRIATWENKLKELAQKPGDAQAIQALKTVVETQLALADLQPLRQSPGRSEECRGTHRRLAEITSVAGASTRAIKVA